MKYIYLVCTIALSFGCSAQDIVGQWETYDDTTKQKKSIVEIYQKEELFFGRIIATFVANKNAVCEPCEGAKKDKPIIGLVIIENLKRNGNEFEGGSILDPESGETYKCKLKLIHNNKLKVRGFLGISIFGRTQYWIRSI